MKPSEYIQAVIFYHHEPQGGLQAYGVSCQGTAPYILSAREREFILQKILPELQSSKMKLVSFYKSGFESPVVYYGTHVLGLNVLYVVAKENLMIAQMQLATIYQLLSRIVDEVSETGHHNSIVVQKILDEVFEQKALACENCSEVCAPKYLQVVTDYLEENKLSIHQLSVSSAPMPPENYTSNDDVN